MYIWVINTFVMPDKIVLLCIISKKQTIFGGIISETGYRGIGQLHLTLDIIVCTALEYRVKQDMKQLGGRAMREDSSQGLHFNHYS